MCFIEINSMVPIASKKKAAEKINKRCLTLDEKINMLDKIKK